MSHTKIPGFVDWIEDDKWVARVFVDGHELSAEMIPPLPKDAGEGSLFTIHKTKRGKTYLYWIRTPWTKRQIKKIRQEARAQWRALGFDKITTEG